MRNLHKETEAAILAWIRSRGGTSRRERKSDESHAYEDQGTM